MATTNRPPRSTTGRTGTPRTSSRVSEGRVPKTPRKMRRSTWKAAANSSNSRARARHRRDWLASMAGVAQAIHVSVAPVWTAVLLVVLQACTSRLHQNDVRAGAAGSLSAVRPHAQLAGVDRPQLVEMARLKSKGHA